MTPHRNLLWERLCSIRTVHGRYNDIKDNEVADEDLGMLPIYIGVDGEENQDSAQAPRTTGA